MHPSTNAFDYLIILLSIILGLAIVTLLGNFARLIDNRERIKLYWVSVLWAVLLFVIQIQHWWSEYSLQKVTHWTFGLFLLVLLTPVGLFLLSSIVLPQTIEGNEDIEVWYYRNRIWFFSIFMALPIISFAKDAVNGPLHGTSTTGCNSSRSFSWAQRWSPKIGACTPCLSSCSRLSSSTIW